MSALQNTTSLMRDRIPLHWCITEYPFIDTWQNTPSLIRDRIPLHWCVTEYPFIDAWQNTPSLTRDRIPLHWHVTEYHFIDTWQNTPSLIRDSVPLHWCVTENHYIDESENVITNDSRVQKRFHISSVSVFLSDPLLIKEKWFIHLIFKFRYIWLKINNLVSWQVADLSSKQKIKMKTYIFF